MFSTKNNYEKIDKINKRVDIEKLISVDDVVKKIILNVKKRGDKAIAEYTEKFDRYETDMGKEKPFTLSIKNTNYFQELEPELQEALKKAKKRIEEYHQNDLKHFNSKDWLFEGEYKEKLGAKLSAIDSVAVYIPGGVAPLVSTLMMTAIPAKIAGVRRIVLFSPPPINKTILAVSELLEIEEIHAIGGAQAIATAAFGTETIERVDKIVGPGNIYVSEAKKMLNGIIGIDGIYGPSELAILCDETAKIEQLAIDLLSQLEHGSGLESTLLVSTNQEIVNNIEKQIFTEIDKIDYSEELRKTIINSIRDWSVFCYEENIEEAIKIINYYAPEHLELQLNKNNLALAKELIKNAGAIFIGENSCESLGDYLAGPSHCLPTAGSSKFASGLQISDFYKKTSIIDFSEAKDINNLLKATSKIARAEGLEAHAKAAEYRLKS
jgi:histidinol dehydrogenase